MNKKVSFVRYDSSYEIVLEKMFKEFFLRIHKNNPKRVYSKKEFLEEISAWKIGSKEIFLLFSADSLIGFTSFIPEFYDKKIFDFIGVKDKKAFLWESFFILPKFRGRGMARSVLIQLRNILKANLLICFCFSQPLIISVRFIFTPGSDLTQRGASLMKMGKTLFIGSASLSVRNQKRLEKGILT